MPGKLPFFNWSLKKALSREEDLIDQARMKMLFYSLLLGILITCVLIPYFAILGPTYQLVRAVILLPIFIILIKLHLARRVWKSIVHTALLVLTALILSNLFFKRFVSPVTVQYVILVILYSIYGLGHRWGIIYSSINILVIVSFLIFGKEVYDPAKALELSGQPAFIMVLSADFFLIFLTHYLFYQSFDSNICQLKNALQVKSDFMSTMSHEMRTPLNAVIGMTNLMLTETVEKGQKENLRILKFSAENLLTVVNDVLDFSKIESGKIDMEQITFNLGELLDNICSGMKIPATEKGLRLITDIPPVFDDLAVIGDPLRFTQIMYNLVGNAIKFTRKGSVTISAKMLEQSAGHVSVRFSVADTGIGISKDKQELIFQPFTQASRNTTREFGGTGLGLSIASHLLTLFNSRMELSSKMNEGSEFSFEITFRQNLSVPEPAVQRPEVAVEPKAFKILLAEDNLINVMLMKKLMLNWWGIGPMVAENGQQAAELAANYDFDIVLMDMHMPVMDGYEAVKQIRALADNKRSGVYVMALTASVTTLSAQNLEEAGIDDYVSKPFNAEALRARIEQVINERSRVS